MALAHALRPVSDPPDALPDPLLTLPWPPAGMQKARKPVGGFVDLSVAHLTLPWWVYQQGQMSFFALRVWHGAVELGERRCQCAPGIPVHYGVEELRRLLREPRRAPVMAALGALQDAGLLTWSAQAIQLFSQPEQLQGVDLTGYAAMRAHVHPQLRWVPMPRPMLRWLARESNPGVLATTLGVLLRCMRYKARQCVSGGRGATTWIAACFGIAERTVQRALQDLQALGWLARLATKRARERPHGRFTVVNLAWQRPPAPGAPEGWGPARDQDLETPGDTRRALRPVDKAPTPHANLSPVPEVRHANLSPVLGGAEAFPRAGTGAAAAPAGTDLEPFQEMGQDPEPAPCGLSGAGIVAPSAGANAVTAPGDRLATSTASGEMDLEATFAALPAAVQAACYAAATARLLAQGVEPAFLIRPVVLAEICRSLQALPAPAPPDALPPCPEVPAAAPAPPTLRDVTPTDLRDVGRVLALGEQARQRGWISGSEADRLHVMAAAVHARRVGQAPCALFVALLRDQRWEVITQEDEDTARGWLRDYLYGPARRTAPDAAAPAAGLAGPLSDDARFVDRVQRVLPRAWQDTPFLAVKLQCRDWTPARWEQAQAELTQWRLQQAQANARRPLASLGAVWEGEAPWVASEDREEDPDAEAND